MNSKHTIKSSPKKNLNADVGLINIDLNVTENRGDINQDSNADPPATRKEINHDISPAQKFKVVVPNFGT